MYFTEENIEKQIEIWNSENLSNEEIDIIFDALQFESIDNKIDLVQLDSTDFFIPYYGNLIAIYVVTNIERKSIIFDTNDRKFYFMYIDDYMLANKFICEYLCI